MRNIIVWETNKNRNEANGRNDDEHAKINKCGGKAKLAVTIEWEIFVLYPKIFWCIVIERLGFPKNQTNSDFPNSAANLNQLNRIAVKTKIVEMPRVDTKILGTRLHQLDSRQNENNRNLSRWWVFYNLYTFHFLRLIHFHFFVCRCLYVCMCGGHHSLAIAIAFKLK